MRCLQPPRSPSQGRKSAIVDYFWIAFGELTEQREVIVHELKPKCLEDQRVSVLLCAHLQTFGCQSGEHQKRGIS